MISNDKKFLDKIISLSDKKDIFGSPFTKFYVFLDRYEVVSFLVFDDIYDRIEIVYIFTKSDYRNKGIASALLNKLINDYSTYINITLEVRMDNKVAISLYEILGFKSVGIRKNYYNNIDGILMKLDL